MGLCANSTLVLHVSSLYPSKGLSPALLGRCPGVHCVALAACHCFTGKSDERANAPNCCEQRGRTDGATGIYTAAEILCTWPSCFLLVVFHRLVGYQALISIVLPKAGQSGQGPEPHMVDCFSSQHHFLFHRCRCYRLSMPSRLNGRHAR